MGLTTETPNECFLGNVKRKLKDILDRIKQFNDKKESFQPEQPFVTLLLDGTLEFDDTIGFRLLIELKPEIESGQLNVIIFKSLQKFASLGTGKFKAGNITIVNNGDPKFKPCSDYIHGLSQDVLQ